MPAKVYLLPSASAEQVQSISLTPDCFRVFGQLVSNKHPEAKSEFQLDG